MEIKNQEIEKIFLIILKIKPKIISKISIDFSKNIYDIDNKYILKINNKTDEICFKKSYFLMNFFKDKIPCPKVIYFDDSKKVIPYFYGIYEKLQGENLTNIWHNLTDSQRKIIIKDICNRLLLPLYTTKYDNSFKEYGIGRYSLDPTINWHDTFLLEINKRLKDVEKRKLLTKKQIVKINNFILKNNYLLCESNVKLTYWDIHFNNIIINPKIKKIVGFIDFEAICYNSIDYPLQVVKRISMEPKIYVSDEFSKYIKKKDYKLLMKWYKKYNPKMFEFNNLDIRLNLYLLERKLKLLLKLSKSKILCNQISKITNKY